MDEDKAARAGQTHDERKNVDVHGAVAAGAAGGALGALITGAVLMGVDLKRDPLVEAVHQDKVVNIQPHQLADEISKNPTLMDRWIALRQFVRMIDEDVRKSSLEQATGGRAHLDDRHWPDPVVVGDRKRTKNRGNEIDGRKQSTGGSQGAANDWKDRVVPELDTHIGPRTGPGTRHFVEKVDREMCHNREQAAAGSQGAANDRKDRDVPDPDTHTGPRTGPGTRL